MTRKSIIELLGEIDVNASKWSPTKIKKYLLDDSDKGFLDVWDALKEADELDLEDDVIAQLDKLAEEIDDGAKITITVEEKGKAHAGEGKGKAAPKAKGEGKGKAAPKAKATPKKKRMTCLCEALQKLPKKGKTFDEVATVANDAFAQAGGKDNHAQTLHTLKVVLPIVKHFEIVSVKKGHIFPA